ncbi:MAG: 3-dehydroquinate synthase [Frankia sp.]|nr:3-dehydroquinate synthase [Frankia sp.]
MTGTASGEGSAGRRPVAVLVGPPGSGKTTVGHIVAERLGVTLRDTDADIEATLGMTVADIFIEKGEETFRAAEREAVASALAEHPGVLALGGGAVLDPGTRAALAGHTVVYLVVDVADAARRVGLARDRPLLVEAPRARLAALLRERRPLYEEVATVVVDTAGRAPEEVAELVLAALGSPSPAAAEPVRIPVRPAGDREYEVVVGPGVAAELPALLAGRTRAAIVHPQALATPAATAADGLRAAGVQTHLIAVPDGEAAKELSVAGHCWDELGRHGFTRDDVVVGFGGGATTDLAGFVAACWLRGVDVAHVPTTVLAMVDAAVGGKTGIDIAAGKNLVGAFHQPLAVLCDTGLLATLPAAEVRAGLAEVVKAGFIADPVILDLLDADPTGASHLPELIERAIRVKADVVSGDPREAGRREILNYGHTLGHAIEKVEGFRWRHGEAISVGMVFAAELSRLAAGLDQAIADRHRDLLARVGLPVSYPGGADAWPDLVAAMRVDKKSRGRRLRFVVLDALAAPRILDDPDPDLLRAAYDAVSADRAAGRASAGPAASQRQTDQRQTEKGAG